MRSGVMVVVSLILFLGLVVSAQAQVKTPASANDVSTDSNTEIKLSEREMTDKASGALKKAKEAITRLLELIEEARKAKDVLKLNGVNEKLTSGKALLRIAEQADVGLQEALVKKDSQSASREYEKVIVASQKLQVIKSEAEAIMGKTYWSSSEFADGKSGDLGQAGGAVEVVEPKDMNAPAQFEQVSTGFDMPMSNPGRPPTASPFQ